MANDGKIKRFMKVLVDGCSGCDRDEAEGVLVDHCAKCQREITTQAHDMFVYELRVIGRKRLRKPSRRET